MRGCGLLADSNFHLQQDLTSLIAHARCADDVTVTLHTVARRMLAANVTATLGVDVPEGASGEQDFSCGSLVPGYFRAHCHFASCV